ncbi:MAG TPA: M28 family peptidase [Flavobacteriales bacterium]|nr:M28 family peptidase [Flavobacteriales bacterium]
MVGKILAAVAFVALGWPAAAQVDSLALHYARWLTEERLHDHLSVLASDEFEGREVGTPGEKKAAAYIMEQFKAQGIPPLGDTMGKGMLRDGYRQEFPVVRSHLGGLRMELGGKPCTFLRDHMYFRENLAKEVHTAEVMLLTPLTAGGILLGGAGKVTMLWDDGGKSATKADLGMLGEMSKGTGMEVLLVVDSSANELMERFGAKLQEGRLRLGGPAGSMKKDEGLQVIMITPELGEAIIREAGLKPKKALKEAATKRVILKVPMAFSAKNLEEELTGQNVLAYLEGGDKKDELVVVTAHLDHVGVQDGEVYNGADDDGSGTVAVLGMAEAFAKAKADGHGPRRSMLFMTVSGEEKGLFGSRWYTDDPVFPLANTVANLNIDMIGRVDSTHEGNDHYVYVIGSKRLSSELGEILEQQNATYTQLELDYTFDADDDPNRFYYRSDHYNFAKHGIPVAFFFNGVHEDYHGPYDEVDKIRFDLLHQRALLVFHTAWELANREDRPVVDGK